MLEQTDQSNRKPFRPNYIADSVATINFSYLQNQGIKAIMIDLDGTVVARAKLEVAEAIAQALGRQPLKIYIATNRPKSRDLGDLISRLGARGVVHPKGVWGKPFARYYKESLIQLGLTAEQVAMVGDRYIQDIYGANRAGLWTVLVRKLDEPVNWFDRWLSGVEGRRTERLVKLYRPIN